MSLVTGNALGDLCRNRLERFLRDRGAQPIDALLERHATQVTNIVGRNVASGRWERVQKFHRSKGKTSGTFKEYVDTVIAVYWREYKRVEGLAAKNEDDWNELWRLLVRRAYNTLIDFGLRPHQASIEAADFAQDTCEAIFGDWYPYDVPFDIRATRILHNRILKKYSRSRDALDQRGRVLSLETPQKEATPEVALHELLADASSLQPFEQRENQEVLLAAIAQLGSEAQQQVIVGTFFHELNTEEIAQQLGRSRQAVYNLRHRALLRLKEILRAKENDADVH